MFGRKAMAISKAGREGKGAVSSANSTADEKDNSADAKPEPAEKIDAALIVFGRDDKGKAHASRFGEDTRPAAMKAAYRMGFVALAVTKDAMRNIAEALPEGRVFESGKAFVPFVKEGTCLALEGHAKQFPRDVLELSPNQIAEIDAEQSADEDGGDAVDGENTTSETSNAESNDEVAKASKGNDSGSGSDQDDDTDANIKSDPPADWVDIKVGTTVLAVDDPDDGWWEAKVTHAHKSGIGTNTITMLTLEWVAYLDEPSFVRRANEVAYFPAGFGQNAPQADNAGKAS